MVVMVSEVGLGSQAGYSKSLTPGLVVISAAVTGQIDVRGEVE